MQFDRHLHEVKANPSTDDARYVAAAVIALEQTVEIARWNADAAIGNGDGDGVGVG